jgi:signal transduction histidine kinase
MASPLDGEHQPGLSRRFSLSQLLTLVAAGPAIVVTVAVVVGIITITRQDSIRIELLTRVEPGNAASLRVLTAMVNQETGIRGYELTGRRSFLEPYSLGLAQARRYEAILKADAVPGTAGDLAVARQRIATWEAETATPALHRNAASPARTPAVIDASLKARAQFDAIRRALAVLQAKLLATVTATKRRLDNSANVTEIALSAIAVALIFSVLSAGLLLRRFVTRPISRLADSARRVRDGELTHSVTLPGPRDLERLAEDVEGMRLALLAELTSSQAMQEQLSVSAANLQRSNTELEQFAYVASHDLQEPLRKVTSFVQLLEDRYSEHLDERGLQYIAFAVDGAKRMQQLINDLLAFSRVGRSSQPFTLTPLDDLAVAAVADLDSVITESGAAVTLGPLPTLAVQPALIRAVFQNLLVNAIKFRSERTPAVTIEAERDGEDWLFSCTDNGIGIAAEYGERIFVIFQRLHTRDAYPGTGIGLAMCRKIVEHHGGRMWLDASHRGGTRMLFTLPASPATDSAESAGPVA